MNLKRGINLGGFLSQCCHELEHYKSFVVESDIKQISDWGFDHIRLPIDYDIFEYDDGTKRDDNIVFVDNMVEYAKKYNLNIILDLHKAPGYNFENAGDETANNLFQDEQLQNRFLNLWDRIANRYGKETHVAFELLNEVVEQNNAEAWNDLIDKCCKVIRNVSTDTPIIYGGIQWNSAKTLKLLRKPEDKNIIFTFHFYEPLVFTHQKAHWVEAIDPNKDIFYPKSMEYYIEESKKLGFQGEGVINMKSQTMGPEYISEMMEEAILAASKANVGLYCGEFGVIDQAPTDDTYRWFADVDSVFRKFDIGCSVWSYKKMDFGFVDEHYDNIREKLLKLWLS